MKLVVVILFIVSCTSSETTAKKPVTTFIVDCRGSYVTGGDGTGYLKGYEWKANNKVISTKSYDTITLQGNQNVIITITDNLGQTKSETVK